MQIFLWTVFSIGSATIIALWVFGFYVVTFGTSYKYTRRIHQEIEEGTDKVFGVVTFFCYRVLTAPLDALAYLISSKYREQVAINRVDWKINVRGDLMGEHDVTQYIVKMLATMNIDPESQKSEALVRSVFGPNWYKTNLEDHSPESDQPLPDKEREDTRAWLKEIGAEEEESEPLPSWPSWINEPVVPKPVEDLVVLVEDKPVAKEAIAPVEAPVIKSEPSLADVIAMIEATNKRLDRLSRSNAKKKKKR